MTRYVAHSDDELEALKRLGHRHFTIGFFLYDTIKRRYSNFKTFTAIGCGHAALLTEFDDERLQPERGCNQRGVVTYDMVREVTRKLIDHGLITPLHNTSSGKQTRVSYFLPLWAAFASFCPQEESRVNPTRIPRGESHHQNSDTGRTTTAFDGVDNSNESRVNPTSKSADESHTITSSLDQDDVSGEITFQNGVFEGITDAMLDSFKQSYPLLDVPHQIQQIAAKAQRNQTRIAKPIAYLDKALDAKQRELGTTPPQQPGDDTYGQRYRHTRPQDIPRDEKIRRIAQLFGYPEPQA